MELARSLQRAFELQQLRAYDEARQLLERAAQYSPNSAQLHNQWGRILYLQQRPQEALQHFERAEALLNKAAPRLRFNQALCYLALGDYVRGFKYYLAKTDIGDDPKLPTVFKKAERPQLWRGETLHDETFLLHCSEGLGDTLQFLALCHHLPQSLKLSVLCPRALHPLLERLPFQLLAPQASASNFDYYSPLYALPHYLRLRQEQLPLTPGILNWLPPKFQRPQTRQARAHPAGPSHKTNQSFKLGLVWRCQRAAPSFERRSLSLPELEGLISRIQAEPLELYSLQYQSTAEEQLWLKRHGIRDLGVQCFDLRDSAEALWEMNALLCVDTVTAHLAGALQIPTYLLLPFEADWRWQLDAESTPWYPSLRLFRQIEPGDWREPFQSISAALQPLLSSPAEFAHPKQENPKQENSD